MTRTPFLAGWGFFVCPTDCYHTPPLAHFGELKTFNAVMLKTSSSPQFLEVSYG